MLARIKAGRDLGINAVLAAEDSLALARLAPLSGGALPWTPFTMRSAAIATLITEVLLGRRRRILECGSGNSTIYIARLLNQIGAGQIVSIDHDASWADNTREILAQENLTAATVLHCPLVEGWYDIPNDLGTGFDMLVVDGPPANTSELRLARLPALPRLRDCLTVDATVALDDVPRSGEQETIERWSSEFGYTFMKRPGGIAVGRRKRG